MLSLSAVRLRQLRLELLDALLQGEETARLGVGLALGLDLLAQSGDELGCAVQHLEVNAPFWSVFPTLFAHRTPMFGVGSGAS